MPIEVLMPALSPTMTEGALVRWLKQEGESIRSGEVLAEIETDKATMELESSEDGRVGQILVAAGTQGVKVNTVIALLLDEGEDSTALVGFTPTAGGGALGPQPSAPAPSVSAPAAMQSGGSSSVAGGRIKASPLARRLAREQNIDLREVTGSGPYGRIVRADIDGFTAAPPPSQAVRAEVPQQTGASASPLAAELNALAATMAHDVVPHSSMRRTIARRLSLSKQQSPHIYLDVDCQLDELLDLRRKLNSRLDKSASISINDILIKACALALRAVPDVNVAWSDDALIRWREAHISVAVATEGGLITPVIRNADQKGLATIAAEMRDLAARAKAGKLKPNEYSGGCFTLSNLGMFGVQSFCAIINPPQTGILAVGAGGKRPVVRDDALAIATCMTVTLSVDHRAVDGAAAASWLAEFRRVLEDPISIML